MGFPGKPMGFPGQKMIGRWGASSTLILELQVTIENGIEVGIEPRKRD